MNNLFLIGFMGAGKSSVSAGLGRMLGREVVEMDQRIAAQEGMSIPELFAQRGERYFRDCERRVSQELAGQEGLVIACGGGGIPVTRQGNHLKGASAVIDKDFASCLLAKELDADFLIILTAVEKAAINYGKPNEKWLGDITVAEAKQYIEEGHFAPGSMLPKVQAAVDFAESKPGRQSLITLLEKARDGILGKTGTRIHL